MMLLSLDSLAGDARRSFPRSLSSLIDSFALGVAEFLNLLTICRIMFIVDETALNFEIPARDSLGREAVIGKLSGNQDKLLLTWRLKDRTFRKAEGDMKTVEIPYTSVESISYKATLGFINPRLILLIREPRLLEDVPGTDIGRAVLFVGKKTKAAATKLIKMVDFKKSEAEANASRSRLLDIPEPGKLD